MKLIIVSWYSPKRAVKKATNLLIEQKRGKWYKKAAHLINSFCIFSPESCRDLTKKHQCDHIKDFLISPASTDYTNNLNLTFTETFSTCFCVAFLTRIDCV